jgi:hypothetical protein
VAATSYERAFSIRTGELLRPARNTCAPISAATTIGGTNLIGRWTSPKMAYFILRQKDLARSQFDFKFKTHYLAYTAGKMVERDKYVLDANEFLKLTTEYLKS